MTITIGNKVPLAQQVAQALKQRVRTGIYLPGQSLPSIRTLCGEFGVSVNVVQRAVRELEENGVLSTHHGKAVRVEDDEHCKRAAILFGFIQPYSTKSSFESRVFHYAGRVFTGRFNFLVTRSSEGSAEQEREVALHFLHNGVKGLLVWPIENDPNGKFFAGLSQEIPVVLVDRLLKGNDLPTVVHDNYDNGRAICRHMLQALNRKRFLVLMDNLDISPYQDLLRGLHDEGQALGRMGDLTILQLPITQFIEKLGDSFRTEVNSYKSYLERLLREGGYDALFCPMGEFVDYVLVESELYRQFQDLKIGMISGSENDPNLTKLRELGVIQWVMDHQGMISQAADLLQQWVLTRKKPQGVTKLKIRMKEN